MGLSPALATGFATGTFIQTHRGMRQIERIEPGVDQIEFRDGTAAPILAMHMVTLSAADAAADPALRPLRVPALALGGTLPVRTMVVAPSISVLAGGRMVNRVADAPEVLLPLAALDGYNGIARVDVTEDITLYHPITATHDLFRADGLICETVFLGDGASPELSAAVREMAPEAVAETAKIPRLDAATAAKLAGKLMSKNRTLGTAEAS
ncbi:MAG: Hint domain-containing protein [Pseudomonadota bacterium]